MPRPFAFKIESELDAKSLKLKLIDAVESSESVYLLSGPYNKFKDDETELCFREHGFSGGSIPSPIPIVCLKLVRTKTGCDIKGKLKPSISFYIHMLLYLTGIIYSTFTILTGEDKEVVFQNKILWFVSMGLTLVMILNLRIMFRYDRQQAISFIERLPPYD